MSSLEIFIHEDYKIVEYEKVMKTSEEVIGKIQFMNFGWVASNYTILAVYFVITKSKALKFVLIK